MRTILVVFGLSLLAFKAPAQTGSSTVDYECLLATDQVAWEALGLSRDQAKRAGQVKEACEEECAETRAKGGSENALLAGYEEELRGILTPEQYTGWLKWCATRAQPTH